MFGFRREHASLDAVEASLGSGSRQNRLTSCYSCAYGREQYTKECRVRHAHDAVEARIVEFLSSPSDAQ